MITSSAQVLEKVIAPETHIGAVTLSVADLARSLDYYQHSIGLKLLNKTQGTAALGAGDRVLLRLHEFSGARLVRRATGLYHFALRVPSRRDLARVIQHFFDTGTALGGASDHLVSEALYLSDPDGHGIEMYRDRPRETWFDAQGNLIGGTNPLDVRSVMSELTADEPAWSGLPDATDMGHIHLQVASIADANKFYMGVLGFEATGQMPSASFISAGRYHHHIGMNTWAGVGVPPPPETAARLLNYEIVLPHQAALDAVLGRVRAAGVLVDETSTGWTMRDPSHNLIVLVISKKP
jgi:catechol 2,3-dioxygenase